MKQFILILGFLAFLAFNTKNEDSHRFIVNVEKIRVTQAADLSVIPGTTADMLIVIDRATAIATGTFPFPTVPVDGQIFMISSRVDVGNVTLNTNGRAISGTIIEVAAGDFYGWVYDLVSDRWFPYGSQTQKDQDILLYQALGSPFISEAVAQKLSYANTATAMVDNQIKYTAIVVPKFTTLTGIKVYVRTLGSYTGDNNNKVGLYSYNKSTGLLTLVASSTNSATLWTSAANAIQTIPFSATYDATPDVYFAAFLYNQSAQTTAPGLASGVALNNAAMAGTAYGFANSAKLNGTSTGNDLPATINMSAITASAVPSWVALY